MTLKEYQKWYVRDEGHWYVSKVKQYHADAIQQFAHILNILTQFFSRNPNPELIKKYKDFRPRELFEDTDEQIRISDHSILFVSLLFLKENLIDQSHLEVVNSKKFKQFSEIQKEFLEGRNYEYFISKYKLSYLKNDLMVYYRNFKSWLGKYGFYGEYANKLCYITDIGSEFAKNYNDLETCCALFNYQIKKYQFWNPTIDKKYKDYKIRPYYILLQVILMLPDNYFTKMEYILFICKIKSHDSNEILGKVKLIKMFRKLSVEDQKKYIEEINSIDQKLFKRRTRTKIDEISDTAPKEIDAYSFGEHIEPGVGENQGKFSLKNAEKARKEITLFTGGNSFIEFEDKLDWIAYLGGMKEIGLEEIIELYVRNGKSFGEIKQTFKGIKAEIDETIADKLYEYEIEAYYVKNIMEIDPNLEVVKKPNYGRQFRTHIGPIDILCKDNTKNEYVVIELKRGQTPDDTIGQVLRYMGWVYINLAKPNDIVRGILVGSSFSEKIDYSLIGTQNNQIFDIIKTFEHPFTPENRPPSIT